MPVKKQVVALLLAAVVTILPACGQKSSVPIVFEPTTAESKNGAGLDAQILRVHPTDQIRSLEDGLSVVRFEGSDGFQGFLDNGGARNDSEVVQYLASSILSGAGKLIFSGNPFGCSAVSAQSPDGDALFGRNFDWYNCDALIVASYPADAYASISTVNTNFIKQAGGMVDRLLSEDHLMTLAALYAPLDGMNEKGLCVSVNMIQDSGRINQNTGKSGITTTTAVRLLLNQAATTDEAIALLQQYDFHASFGLTIHFAISDRTGKMVSAEYIDQELVITESPVVTNFYLAPGDKYGVGTAQSMERYQILMQTLEENATLTEEALRSALESVCKKHYHDGETTEWSIVFNQNTLTATYYHRENYTTGYTIALEGTKE